MKAPSTSHYQSAHLPQTSGALDSMYVLSTACQTTPQKASRMTSPLSKSLIRMVFGPLWTGGQTLQHLNGSSFRVSAANIHVSHGCLVSELWGTHHNPANSRAVVLLGSEDSYKCQGARSYLFSLFSLLSTYCEEKVF